MIVSSFIDKVGDITLREDDMYLSLLCLIGCNQLGIRHLSAIADSSSLQNISEPIYFYIHAMCDPGVGRITLICIRQGLAFLYVKNRILVFQPGLQELNKTAVM